MKKILGIINLHTSSVIPGLNETRSLASTSFLGRYNLIDFALSNFTNSNIDRIGVLVKRGIRSLIRHIGFGHWWTDNTKTGQLAIMFNELATSNEYNHDVNNLIENNWVYEDTDVDYVIFAPSDIILKIDFNDLIEQHKNNKCRITLVTQRVTNARDMHRKRYAVYTNQNSSKVLSFKLNIGDKDEVDIFTGIMIMDKDTLLSLLKYAKGISTFFNLNETISYLLPEMSVKTYEFKDDIIYFDTLKDYLENSIKLINPEVTSRFCNAKSWPVFTKTYDSSPVLFKDNCRVLNSYIANGAIIEGTIKNCVIGRNVIIEEGCNISDSVILSDTYISKNTVISSAVIDKNVKVLRTKKIVGTKENPMFIKKGDVV